MLMNVSHFKAKDALTMKYRPTLYACAIQDRQLFKMADETIRGINLHYDDLKHSYYDEDSEDQLYRRTIGFHYPISSHYLETMVHNSKSLSNLYENLYMMENWLFLSVGPQSYGFYSSDDAYINIRDGLLFMKVYPSITFEHESDLLMFKLKYG